MTLKKWTITRRCIQVAVIGLIASPLFGLAFFQGNLSAASLFSIGLADPLAFLQATLAGRVFVPSFLGAALLMTLVYFLMGGRSFCGWICPVYLLTEFGDKLSATMGFARHLLPLAGVRWALALVLAVSLAAGIPLFEVLSPIGITARAIMFSSWQPLLLVVAILVVEIFAARRVWCRTLCPVGGFYSLLGRFSPVRVAFEAGRCTQCGECSRVCPVQEVLLPARAGGDRQIVSGDCTRCGACIDACRYQALRMGAGYR